MSDTPIPTYRDLMYPTLVAVQKLGGSAAIAELDETVIEVAHITEEQLAVEYPPTGTASGSKVVHRLHWARTYLKAVGALDNSERGVWSLNKTGAGYLNMPPEEADVLLRAADKQARAEWRKARKQQAAEHEADEEVDGDQSDEAAWNEQLLEVLKKMDPNAFERLAMRLLREAGFVNLEVTPSSGDEGIDGVGVYKPSLVSFPIYFQCKRYKGSVGPGVVRDFRGAMTGRGEKGLVITTGVFTPAAKKEATRDGAPPVDLIDGDELCDLLKENSLGVSVTKRVVEDVEVDVSFFESL
ncbi:MAG: restriction endonuclease [bacterium]|nr:restriction endonuclease [bacterium]